ncbi:MAG: DNA repair protein RadC [Defluviitaleaceae bacterium]|nr:DNA repair protein RadC [Defluviitaleaceae bacterium]
MSENPNKGHRMRLRERFIKAGLEAFAPHEVLELLLFYAIPQRDTKPLAKRMIDEFGGLPAIFETDPTTLMQRTGVTENVAVYLSMMSQLFGRYHREKYPKTIKFINSYEMKEYAKVLFIGKTVECFYLICLDNAHNMRACELIAEGDIDQVELHPRKIVERATAHRATNLILAHNHPSGQAHVTRADLVTTANLVDIFRPFNIRIVDHIIIAGDAAISLAENGYMG